MRILFILLFSLATTAAAFAQKDIDATYKIRVGAFAKPLSTALIESLQDLGDVTLEGADNGLTRVYLGRYMGKATAQRVAAQVRKRGHKDVYIVRDNYLFENQAGAPQTKTLQVLSAKKLDIEAVRKSMIINGKDMPLSMSGQLFVQYENGFYRVCAELYAETDTDLIEAHRAFLTKIGYKPLLRTFRKAK